MVERLLPKQNVASSNLVSRSNFPVISLMAPCPSGKGEVCKKPLCSGSIPLRASNFQRYHKKATGIFIDSGGFFCDEHMTNGLSMSKCY